MADDKTIRIKLDSGGGDDDARRWSNFEANDPSQLIQTVQEQAAMVNEALNSFSFATQEVADALDNTQKVGKRRGRPPKDEDPNEPTPDDLGKEKPLPLKILQNLQKFVTAFEGVNGRATKALAVLTRSTKAYYEHQEKAAKATAAGAKTAQAATAATAAGTKATAATVVATTATATAMGVIGKVLGGLAIVVAGVSAAFLVAAVAAKGLSKLIENLQEVVGGLSGKLAAAKGQTQVAETRAQLDAANKVGGELASLERTNSDLKTSLNDLKASFIQIIGPFTKLVGEIVVKILQVLNTIFSVLSVLIAPVNVIANGFSSMLSGFTGLFKTAKRADAWFVTQEVKDNTPETLLNKQVEAIFDQDGFNHPFPKGRPMKNFFPKGP